MMDMNIRGPVILLCAICKDEPVNARIVLRTRQKQREILFELTKVRQDEGYVALPGMYCFAQSYSSYLRPLDSLGNHDIPALRA